MIARQDLLDNGWVETKDIGFFTKGKLEKKIGRVTYMASVTDKLWLGVFVGQDPEEPFSMSMRGVVFNGRCPDMGQFDFIFNLVRLKESESEIKEDLPIGLWRQIKEGANKIVYNKGGITLDGPK